MKYEVIEDKFGKCWYLNGRAHREGGPAIEWNDGTKLWYLNGNLHREDGPACEYASGNKDWWLNGIEYTEEEYWEINRGT